MVAIRGGRARGFTLVELLVVVVIGLILTTLGAGGFRDLVDSESVKNASFDLFSTLMQARSEALTRNGEVRVVPVGTDWSQGWLILSGDGLQLGKGFARSGVSITGPRNVTFRGNGRPSGDTGPFVVTGTRTNPDDFRCLRLNPSGRAQVSRGSCS